MSDFIGHFWHLYVAGLVLVSIIACLLLLWFSGKAKAMTANDNTTGHVWDGDSSSPLCLLLSIWLSILVPATLPANLAGLPADSTRLK